MAEIGARSVTVARRRFDLRRETIERAVRQVLPDPIASHYVVIGPRRYPPKQVVALATGLDRADFTTHQARRILMGLGFAVGRLPLGRERAAGRGSDAAGDREPAGGDGPGSERRRREPATGDGHRGELARLLAGVRGQWVAIKDDQLLVAAPTPHEVVGWLAKHDRRADSMFRVPEDEIAAGGLAPL